MRIQKKEQFEEHSRKLEYTEIARMGIAQGTAEVTRVAEYGEELCSVVNMIVNLTVPYEKGIHTSTER